MEIISCPICGEKSFSYFNYKDYFDELVNIYKCINCGHGSHCKVYTELQMLSIYKSNYSEIYLNNDHQLFQKRQVQYKLDVDLLLRTKNFGKVKVLDFGCSSGGYLDAMPNEWDKYGFEVNPFHLKYIDECKKHITIFDSLEQIDCKFDIITLRGVIEHISNHSDLIEFLSKHLTEKGVVFVSATPDFSSVCATLYKSKWSQIACPQHIHQFSSTSLSILMAKAGLKLQTLDHPYANTPYAECSRDKEVFIKNVEFIKNGCNNLIHANHAFPGNMLSALYER